MEIFSSDFSDLNSQSITLGGSSSFGEQNLALIPDQADQVGSAIISAPVTVGPDIQITAEWTSFVPAKGIAGGDGWTFGLFPEVTPIIDGDMGYEGAQNSIAIEYDSNAQIHDSLTGDHIGVNTSGNTQDSLLSVAAPFNLNGPQTVYNKIEYDGKTDTLSVWASLTQQFSEDPLLSTTVEVEDYVPDQAYIGFTAGTSARSNKVIIDDLTISANNPPAPPEQASPSDGFAVQPDTIKIQILPEDNSGFTDIDGDIHDSTNWQILQDGEVVAEAQDQTGFTATHIEFPNEFTGVKTLSPGENYQLKIEVADQYGDYSRPAFFDFTTEGQTQADPQPTGDVPYTVEDGYTIRKFNDSTMEGFTTDMVYRPDIGVTYVATLHGDVYAMQNDGSVSSVMSDILQSTGSRVIPGAGEYGTTGVEFIPQDNSLLVTTILLADGEEQPIIYKQPLSADGLSTTGEREVFAHFPFDANKSHHGHEVRLGPDGKIWVGIMDGFVPANALNLDASDPNAAGGKMYRYNFDGSPAEDNPLYDPSNGINNEDAWIAVGFRNSLGFDFITNGNTVTKLVFANNGPGQSGDPFNVLDINYKGDPISSLGWSGELESFIDPLHVFVPTQVAGQTKLSSFGDSDTATAYFAAIGPTFAQGNPSRGKMIWEMDLNSGQPTPFVEYVGNGFETTFGLEFHPEGLLFTDLYGGNVWLVEQNAGNA